MKRPSAPQLLLLRRMRAGMNLTDAAASRWGMGDGLDGELRSPSTTHDALVRHGWIRFEGRGRGFVLTDEGVRVLEEA